jgi:NAD(P)H dehydrogenase (quinone)
MAPSYAVTGATGRVGSRVARQLAHAGAFQRCIVRDTMRAPRLPRAEAAGATYDDGEAMRRALEGMNTLFLVSAAEAENRIGEHAVAVDAARDAGVERIVYLSFLSAAPDATFTFARDHWHTEEHIRASGLRFTFLRDSLYQDFLPVFVGDDLTIRGPAGDGRVSVVAIDDVADVATAVLLADSEHDGLTYDVTGPDAITLEEAARELSRGASRTVRYQPETLQEAYDSRAHFDAPAYALTGWVTTYVAIATGELSAVSDTVERVTGHRPSTLAETLQRHPELLQHLRTAAG